MSDNGVEIALRWLNDHPTASVSDACRRMGVSREELVLARKRRRRLSSAKAGDERHARSATKKEYPLLYLAVGTHVDYYKQAQEYVGRGLVVADLRKDSQFPAMLAEASVDADGATALSTFEKVAWQVTKLFMNTRTGWWARKYGRQSEFFHEDWGTPEDWRDCINLRLKDREKDQAAIDRAVAICEDKCGQLGWSFDPQYDEAGALAHIEVWKKVAA